MAKSNINLKLSNLVAKEAIGELLNKATLVRESDKTYASEFGNDKDRGRPTGSTISIRKPAIFTTDDNIVDLNLQGINQDYTTLTVKSTKVEIGEDRFQGAVEAPDTYSGLLQETGKSIGGALGSKLEKEAFAALYGNSAVVGTAANVLDAEYVANEQLVNNLYAGDAFVIGNPGFGRRLKSELVTLLNQGKSDAILDRNWIGYIDGKDVFESTVLGVYNMPAAPSTAITLTLTEGSATATASAAGLQVGMVVTFGFNLANAQTKGDTGIAASRSVIAVDGTTVTLSEAIYTEASGVKQNVALTSISGAQSITVVGQGASAVSYDQAFVIGRKAFTSFTLKPGKAQGPVTFEVAAEEDSGVKLTGIYGWSFTQEQNVLNVSTLYVNGVLRPEWISRVLIPR
jgi:hypothetical protein